MAITSFERSMEGGSVLGVRWRIAKRGVDLAISLVMIVLFAPLMLLIAALVLVHDGGGVIYRHERVGKGGRRFQCLKFRTMVRDADVALARLIETDPLIREEWSRSRKLRQDPRIIPGVGHLLRKSSLDELPQIFNVLAGDMSIVGPRPVTAEELSRYASYQERYLSVRPGLTGLWQISGRSDASYKARVDHDVAYVNNWNMALDLRILLLTIVKFVSGQLGGAR